MKPKKYAIYSTFEEDNYCDLNSLIIRQRKLTKAYKNRLTAVFRCSCNSDKPSPMLMSVDGRLYDASASNSTHIDKCFRYKERIIYGGMRVTNFNPNKAEFLLDEFEEKEHIDVRESLGSDTKTPYTYREGKFLSIVANSYKLNIKKYDGYDLIRVAASTYSTLSRASYKTKKGTELKATVNVGIIRNIFTDKKHATISIGISGCTLTVSAPLKIVKKAKADFKKMYKVEVGECKDILAIYITFENQDKKKAKVKDQLMFVLTSACGMPCESLFEKRVYDLYEFEFCKYNKKDIVFNKNYQECVYQIIDNNVDYLDDGEFKLVNSYSNKIVVLEVFGMVHKPEYAAECEVKRDLLSCSENIYLLDILPEDNDASIVAKFNLALEWLRNPLVSA